jgi:hypothetical protein
MTLVQFYSFFISILPVLFVINGLVTLAGKFGLSGKLQLAFALVLGVVGGVLGYLTQAGLPASWQQIFWSAIAGLLVGVISSLFYEFIKAAFEKGMEVFIKQVESNATMGSGAEGQASDPPKLE